MNQRPDFPPDARATKGAPPALTRAQMIKRTLSSIPLTYALSLDETAIVTAPSEPEEPICGLIHVARLMVDTDGGNASFEVVYETRDGRIESQILRKADLVGMPRKVICRLADRGFACFKPPAKIASLILNSRILQACRTTILNVPGWAPALDAYALPDGTILAATPEQQDAFRHNGPCTPLPQPAGTLEGWQDEIAAKADGDALPMTVVMHALAGPLLPFLRHGACGLHLHGGTPAERAGLRDLALSAWQAAGPLRWSEASDRLRTTITAHRHGFLTLEDLPIRAGREVQTLGAALSGRAGGVDLSGAESPACAWLSTGAESLAAVLQQASPACVLRPPALELTLPDARGAGDRAGGNAPMANRGLAGRRLVEALARSRRVLVASVPDLKAEGAQSIEAVLGLDESTDPKLRARLKDWTTIACAGTIGAQLGILPWSEQDCRAAVAEAASRWLDADPMGLGPQGRAILTAVGRHLAAHRPALPPFKADYPNAPVGWRCSEFFHLRAEPFFAALRPVADAHAVKRTLEDAGYLVAPDTGRSQRWRAPRWVPGQPRLLRLRLDLLAEAA